jgi:transcriptional regulator with XRE-family HTH domain
MALQIRALREQRHMSQTELGHAIDMAQTWVSKLENPDYGKMSVTTLLRLAHAFGTDLEIKFRPFSTTIDRLSKQSDDYFLVPSFKDEFEQQPLSETERNAGFAHLSSAPVCTRIVTGSAMSAFKRSEEQLPSRIGAKPERQITDGAYAAL